MTWTLFYELQVIVSIPKGDHYLKKLIVLFIIWKYSKNIKVLCRLKFVFLSESILQHIRSYALHCIQEKMQCIKGALG